MVSTHSGTPVRDSDSCACQEHASALPSRGHNRYPHLNANGEHVDKNDHAGDLANCLRSLLDVQSWAAAPGSRRSRTILRLRDAPPLRRARAVWLSASSLSASPPPPERAHRAVPVSRDSPGSGLRCIFQNFIDHLLLKSLQLSCRHLTFESFEHIPICDRPCAVDQELF